MGVDRRGSIRSVEQGYLYPHTRKKGRSWNPRDGIAAKASSQTKRGNCQLDHETHSASFESWYLRLCFKHVSLHIFRF